MKVAKAQIQTAPTQIKLSSANKTTSIQNNFNSKQRKPKPAKISNCLFPKIAPLLWAIFIADKLQKFYVPHFSFYKSAHSKVVGTKYEHSNLTMAKLEMLNVTRNGISQKKDSTKICC